MSSKESLPDPFTDTAEWYQKVVERAELAEHAPVKGCMVIRPYGYAVWELIRDALDARLKERGVSNAYFPLFIPHSFLAREEAHVEGFSPECAVVTHAGGDKLDEPLVVRPTSETIIHDSMARWIRSYRDLPLRLNQWANVVRWERRPRLFLRNTEFLWQEGHTGHATEAEARDEVRDMLALYHDFVETSLAIATVTGRKSEREKFAGAVESQSIEGLMHDGKGLQMGTVHYLGENFSRMANVRYLDRGGAHRFVQMTSWGVSTRLIGALILSHGDTRGLVLPPRIAPIQAVIVPVAADKDPRVMVAAVRLREELRVGGLRAEVDARPDMTPGAKYFHWEVRGVPLRIEVGPRDVAAGQAAAVPRFGGSKRAVRTDDGGFPQAVLALLEDTQRALLAASRERLQARTVPVADRERFVAAVERQAGFIRAPWCGESDCEKEVKDKTMATIRNLPADGPAPDAPCAWCGKPGRVVAHYAKAY